MRPYFLGHLRSRPESVSFSPILQIAFFLASQNELLSICTRDRC
ncbi:MAG: hypothetical protein AB4290_01640 [Spirulina sp.]